jgi:HlyD family secretion protein
MKRLLPVLCLVLSACSRQSVPNSSLTVSGRIEADEVDLAFKIAGRVVEITVREGDAVKPGDILARLAGPQEEIRLKEAEARLAGALARVTQAQLSVTTLEQHLKVSRIQEEQAGIDAQPRVDEAQARLAAIHAELTRAQADEAMVRTDAERYAVLAQKGAVAQQIADQFQSRVKIARASVESAEKQVTAAESSVQVSRATLKNAHIRAAEARVTEAQVEEARATVKLAETEVSALRAAVDRARADVAELVITSTCEGAVIIRSAEPGRVVSPGQVVLTIVDGAHLYLRGFIPVAHSDLVKVGQSARITLPSGASMDAQVIRIDPQAMFTPENTYFKEERVKQVVGIKLGIKDNSGQAKVGMPADAIIRIS